MRLSQLKQNTQVMTRRFAYPPEAKAADRFTVAIHYFSPALFNEKRENATVKIVQGGQRRNRDEQPDPEEIRKVLASEVLIQTIEKIEDCTIAKLAKLLPMSPEAIAAAGGLDAPVPMDTTATDQSAKDAARDNLIFLMQESVPFFNWLLNVCTDLANFQDEAWEEQVRNLRNGQPASSELR